MATQAYFLSECLETNPMLTLILLAITLIQKYKFEGRIICSNTTPVNKYITFIN